MLLRLENVFDPIDNGVGLRIVTEFKSVQPRKAKLPMLVTEFGMVMEVKPV